VVFCAGYAEAEAQEAEMLVLVGFGMYIVVRRQDAGGGPLIVRRWGETFGAAGNGFDKLACSLCVSVNVG